MRRVEMRNGLSFEARRAMFAAAEGGDSPKQGGSVNSSGSRTLDTKGKVDLKARMKKYSTSVESINLTGKAKEKTIPAALRGRAKLCDMPSFRRDLKDQTFQEGDPVVLRCQVKTIPTTDSVSWYKDGEEITENQNMRINFDGSTAKLRILDAEPGDRGEYTCRAINSAGEASTSCLLSLEDDDDEEEDDMRSAMKESSATSSVLNEALDNVRQELVVEENNNTVQSYLKSPDANGEIHTVTEVKQRTTRKTISVSGPETTTVLNTQNSLIDYEDRPTRSRPSELSKEKDVKQKYTASKTLVINNGSINEAGDLLHTETSGNVQRSGSRGTRREEAKQENPSVGSEVSFTVKINQMPQSEQVGEKKSVTHRPQRQVSTEHTELKTSGPGPQEKKVIRVNSGDGQSESNVKQNKDEGQTTQVRQKTREPPAESSMNRPKQPEDRMTLLKQKFSLNKPEEKKATPPVGGIKVLGSTQETRMNLLKQRYGLQKPDTKLSTDRSASAKTLISSSRTDSSRKVFEQIEAAKKNKEANKGKFSTAVELKPVSHRVKESDMEKNGGLDIVAHTETVGKSDVSQTQESQTVNVVGIDVKPKPAENVTSSEEDCVSEEETEAPVDISTVKDVQNGDVSKPYNGEEELDTYYESKSLNINSRAARMAKLAQRYTVANTEEDENLFVPEPVGPPEEEASDKTLTETPSQLQPQKEIVVEQKTIETPSNEDDSKEARKARLRERLARLKETIDESIPTELSSKPKQEQKDSVEGVELVQPEKEEIRLASSVQSKEPEENEPEDDPATNDAVILPEDKKSVDKSSTRKVGSSLVLGLNRSTQRQTGSMNSASEESSIVDQDFQGGKQQDAKEQDDTSGSEHEVEEEGSGSDGGQEEETEDIPQTDTPTVNGKLATTDQDMASLSATKEAKPRRYNRQSKPIFIIKPRRQFIDEGQCAKFKASIDGEPKPSLVWEKDGTVLEDSEKYKIYNNDDFHFLEVQNIGVEDKGNYCCVISNSVGKDRAEATLEVFVRAGVRRRRESVAVPPKVAAELKDQTIVDGEPLILECSITGEPQPTISWYHEGKLLKSSDDIKQTYDGKTASLTFTEVFPDDSGRYECVAVNSAGEKRTACKVTVEEAKPEEVSPSFTEQIKSQTVNDGDSVTLQCSLTGIPAPTIIWYREGKEIKPSQDFKITYDGTTTVLNIVEVFPEDEGQYMCVAKNSAGEARTTGHLKVEEENASPPPPPTSKPPPPPVSPKRISSVSSDIPKKEEPHFIRKLTDKVAHDGDRVELTVEVGGKEPLEVCWLHADKEIKKDDSVYQMVSKGNVHTLLIPEVFQEDEGLYLCEVYNQLGDEECTCQLTVKEKESEDLKSNVGSNAVNGSKHIDEADYGDEEGEVDGDEFFPPEFVQNPKSAIVDEGSSASFSCQIVANPPPKVRWEKDGIILKGERFLVTIDEDTYKLEIIHTLATDAGRYQVIAKNSEGTSHYSASLVVKQLEAPECSDFRSLLKSRPQLKTIGATLAEKEAEQIDFRHVLSKSMGSGSSKGKDNEAEQIDFRNVLTRHVQTKQRPRVLKELQDVRAREGNSVTLECKLSGIPPPKVVWYMGKKEIKESKYFKMSFEDGRARLVIAEVYPEDEGEYMCWASNEAGSTQSTCDIIVHELSGYSSDELPKEKRPSASDVSEPPFIEDLTPDNIQVLRGKKFQLKGKFAGEPPPEIKWFRDKTQLINDGRIKIDFVRDTTTLTVQEAELIDTGRYTLIIENELGTDNCSSSVTVEDRPDPPVDVPAASNITLNSLTLSWYGPSYDGGSTVTDYRIEVCRSDTRNWKTLTSSCKHTTYQVKSLDPNTEYLFRVSAANKNGFSDPGKESCTVMTVDRRGSNSKPDELSFEPRHVDIDAERNFHDNYSLKEEIGKGRFGNVYKCIEKSTDKTFAAKFIKVKPSERNETKTEIRIMNELHHPKLLLLFDAFESRKEMVLVMEHVAGGELFERIIDDDYILTERECVHFMRQICDGVLYMHSQNILHLDLKPENILCITPNSNEIKIIDFGLARKFDPKTNFKVMFGTPEFVAPEVVNYDLVNHATDMWSVGVIAYILVSGLSPFMGNQDTETLVNVTMAQWDFEDDTFDDISESAKDFIEGLLIKDKKNRMSAEECLAHTWLSQDVKFMRAKRLSTDKHKRFMARRKWQVHFVL